MPNPALEYEREQARKFRDYANDLLQSGNEDLAHILSKLTVACLRKIAILEEFEAYRAHLETVAKPVQDSTHGVIRRPHLVTKSKNGTFDK